MIYSAQGSITVKRLRSGDSIYLTLDLNGKPLYQSVDEQTGAVSPDWSVDANRPEITPHASTVRSATVTLHMHHWQYNGVDLVFNGATTGGYTKDSTGKFAMNAATGALRIMDNLASTTNMANDTLVYTTVAVVNGVEYNMSKSIDVQIQKSGASSYYGFINTSTTQLDSNVQTAELQAQLWLAANVMQDFYVKWYKNSTEWTDKRGQKSITVTREDVDGSQLFIAEFYLSSADATPVFRAGLSIVDILDEIIVVPYISSSAKEVDTGTPVTVRARIVRAASGTVITPSDPSWVMQVIDGVTWQQLREVTTDHVDITTADMDQQDGSSHDIVVIVQVSYN